MTKPTLLLEAHLKALRLPTFLREYDKVARHCAQEGLDCPRYLFRLCELELLDREQRATERRIKAAKLPVLKSLETFEFRAIPSVNKRLVLELTRSEYRFLTQMCARFSPSRSAAPWEEAADVLVPANQR